jgi:hypothetical protein
MTTTTHELVQANDTLRAEYPNALIVDATFAIDGFRLTVIPRGIHEDSQVGKGQTVADAMDDLRAKLAENNPLAKLRAEADKHGYVLTKMPTD